MGITQNLKDEFWFSQNYNSDLSDVTEKDFLNWFWANRNDLLILADYANEIARAESPQPLINKLRCLMEAHGEL